MATVHRIVSGEYFKDAATERYSQTWIVETTGTKTGSAMYEATRASGIPQIGDAHPDIGTVRLDSLSARPQSGEARVFEVTGQYTNTGGSESASSKLKNAVTFELVYRSDKWDFPALFSHAGQGGILPPDATEGNGIEFYQVREKVDFSRLGWTLGQKSSDLEIETDAATYDKVVYRDINGEPLLVQYNGKWQVGVARQFQKAEVPVHTIRATASVTGQKYSLADVSDMLGKVNKRQWGGYAARTWRIDRMAGNGRVLRL